tara:strand:+ start:16 stop:1008 length:993 start_codon:yes stop_codon:yes gene_type:complete
MPYIGTSPSNGVRRVFDYTATAGQTSFSGSDNNSQTLAYTDSAYIDVYQNGILLIPSDYTATTGTTVVLDTGATVSDTLQIVVYDVFSVADTVSASDGGSFGGNIGVGGTLSVTGNVISPITLAGTTPTLTIGDAGAEDAKIVFDGNAQDYHIGLDDSTDSLTIGLGSALGTTSHIVTNASGEVTKPLQPSFLVNKGGTAQSNFSRNADVVVTFGTEVFDVGANFASNAFTAPVTGKYVLNAKIRMSEIDSAATYYAILIVTSNRNYSSIYDPRGYDQDPVNFSFNESAIVDMDANDTAQVQVYQAVGTDEHTSISGSAAYTNFGGYLLG